MNLTNSNALVKRALKVFPGGANTLSKYPERRRTKCPVMYYGESCYLWDVDNNKYIDWTAGLGAIILGYEFEQSSDKESITPLFSSVTKEEILLAEKLIEIIPCAEQVRFFKTGSESTLAAIRLARAITDRINVLYSGFHGWHDWYANGTDKYKGSIYNCACSFEYGTRSLELFIKEYNPACIIMEPVNRNCPEKASKEYLQEVRELCTKNNILLIFDEILSGFRYDIGGISTLWDIEPDLACYSKAMANGWPIAALVGKEKYMSQMKDLMISGTFNGEILSCINALETINFIQKKNVIADINAKALYMIHQLLNMTKDLSFIQLKYFKSKFDFVWSDQTEREVFHNYIIENGIYSNDNHFMMYAHRQGEIDKTLEVYKKGFNLTR